MGCTLSLILRNFLPKLDLGPQLYEKKTNRDTECSEVAQKIMYNLDYVKTIVMSSNDIISFKIWSDV